MLYHNSWNKVRVKTVNSSSLALLMGLIAELQCSVNAAILEVVNFLKDSDAKVRLATVEALSEVSDRGKAVDLLVLALFMKMIAEFRPSIVTAIHELVTLLKDSDTDVCKACITALSKFSGQGKTGYASNLDLLTRIIVEFQALISPAIHDMVKSLSDCDSNVHLAYVDALSQLSRQGKRRNWLSLASLMEVIAEF